ncbi:hypothetical protein L873DRAFT_1844146 [Choiromyces venosus 120613-1]|uniref:Uncharacterized protein n=1 Tax=Choiromyces venosus 120613-1 TaxID=1336337 RepID=A0A3N4JY76_9PEZI|nr:hypothetical protein L873DRAFT_1844146 [Choiromyces venosus 120613-1]
MQALDEVDLMEEGNLLHTISGQYEESPYSTFATDSTIPGQGTISDDVDEDIQTALASVSDTICGYPIPDNIPIPLDCITSNYEEDSDVFLETDSLTGSFLEELFEHHSNGDEGRNEDYTEKELPEYESQSPWFQYSHAYKGRAAAPDIQNPWHPFLTKVFAILYTLVHSQERMFTHTQLESIWVVLRCLSNITILSLSSIKCFKSKIPSPHVFQSEVENTTIEPYFHISICDLVRIESASLTPFTDVQEIGHTVLKPLINSRGEIDVAGERYYKEVWTGKKWSETSALQLPVCYLLSGEEIWFGDLIEFVESGNVHGWGICHGQTKLVTDENEEIYLQIQRLHKLENGGIVFPVEKERTNQKIELLPLRTIHRICYPSYEFPATDANQTMVIAISEENSNQALQLSQNTQTRYEIMSAQDIEEYFPVHLVKKLRDYMDPNLSVHQFNINLWQDGLSGNWTKKWNPHECTLLSFPGILRQNNNYLRFIGIAKNTNGISLLNPILKELKLLQKGILGFNSASMQSAILTGSLLMMKGDNPASSELANHAWQSSYPCRLCIHSKNQLASEDSHLPGIIQEATYRNMRSTIEILLKEVNNPSVRPLLSSGLKITHGISPLFFLFDFNPFMDQPFEQLHTWLLGPLKHITKAFLSWAPWKSYQTELKGFINALNWNGFQE